MLKKSIFVSPDGKPYIITMRIYLISVSVSDVSLEQAVQSSAVEISSVVLQSCSSLK